MSRSSARGTLTRARIVEAAVVFADRNGLEATTMRRLGEALGVTPMALYKHVAGREQLIDDMVDHIVSQIPAAAAQGWKNAVRTRILTARGALRSHAWAQDAIESRTMASPVVLGYMDALMAAMFAGGLSADLVHHGMHALSTRMWGFTRDVMPTPAMPADPAERQAMLAAAAVAFPSIVRMAAAHADAACDDDAEFAFALDLLLDGIERRHREGWVSR
ncbi:TetR/AcrR family transcriptional regulator [Microbacterium sp.]|uniref:TetR/AcrR family transcriptional regulator n=1 Tax=Microbacterium sp. TaxID=51671 RepID=UPI0039E6A2ED